MDNKTITFMGGKVEVPRVSAHGVARLTAGLLELRAMAGIDGEAAVKAVKSQDYSQLVQTALTSLSANISSCGSELTSPEKLIYGVLGDMVNCSAEAVARAPFEDLENLIKTVIEQERNTSLGKRLIDTFTKQDAKLTKSTEKGKS